jgi:hypothetical protein
MLSHLSSVIAVVRLSVGARRDLLMEIAALRHQLEVLGRSGAKPRLCRADRMLWIWLCRTWPKCQEALVIVQPETVLRWHRAGYRHYWRWKTRGKVGRSRIPRAHIEFTRRISRENPGWGEDKIGLEMKLKVGVEHTASTIRRYRVDDGPMRSSTWRTFLGNHCGGDLVDGFRDCGDVGLFGLLRLGDARAPNAASGGYERDPESDVEVGEAADPGCMPLGCCAIF